MTIYVFLVILFDFFFFAGTCMDFPPAHRITEYAFSKAASKGLPKFKERQESCMIYKNFFFPLCRQDDQDAAPKDSSAPPPGDIDDLIFGEDEYYVSQR